jgi:hypothetical protein
MHLIDPVLVYQSQLEVGLSDFAIFRVFDVISQEWLEHFFQKFGDAFISMVSIVLIDMENFSKGIIARSRSLHPSRGTDKPTKGFPKSDQIKSNQIKQSHLSMKDSENAVQSSSLAHVLLAFPVVGASPENEAFPIKIWRHSISQVTGRRHGAPRHSQTLADARVPIPGWISIRRGEYPTAGPVRRARTGSSGRDNRRESGSMSNPGWI